MKTMILLCSFFASSLAFAQPVESCLQDQLTAEKIAEIPADERMDVLNKKGEVVGAITIAGQDRVDSLYLCGNNSGYYYVKAQLSDWLSESKREIHDSEIYNDEYDATGSVQTIQHNGSPVIILNLNIKFSGDQEDADYQAFSAQVFIPVKK